MTVRSRSQGRNLFDRYHKAFVEEGISTKGVNRVADDETKAMKWRQQDDRE